MEKEIEIEVLRENFKQIEKENPNYDFPKFTISFFQGILFYIGLIFFFIIYVALSFFYLETMVLIIEIPILKPIIIALPPFLLALYQKKQEKLLPKKNQK